jgi:uncharacterized protein (DUF433 family)
MNGRPCLRDTHVAVATVISLLASGRNETEVVRRFPALSLNDIREALTYAAWEIDPTETAVHPISPEAARPIVPPLPRYLQPPVHHPLVPPTAPDAASAPVPAAPAPDESLEFFHPSRPDRPTVLLSSHGIIDRRWSTGIIAWSDIRDIRRVTGEKTIVVTLRNPRNYLSSLPFLPWLIARIRLLINLRALYLDTASLGIRTQDLLFAAQRLWLKHRSQGRKRHRVRTGRSKSKRSMLADDFQLE